MRVEQESFCQQLHFVLICVFSLIVLGEEWWQRCNPVSSESVSAETLVHHPNAVMRYQVSVFRKAPSIFLWEKHFLWTEGHRVIKWFVEAFFSTHFSPIFLFFLFFIFLNASFWQLWTKHTIVTEFRQNWQTTRNCKFYHLFFQQPDLHLPPTITGTHKKQCTCSCSWPLTIDFYVDRLLTLIFNQKLKSNIFLCSHCSLST